MRSMRGPETLARYFSIWRCEISSVAKSPVGLGFMAAMSMKRAGKGMVE